MNKIVVGLCEGRHDMPVVRFLLPNTCSMDFNALESSIKVRLDKAAKELGLYHYETFYVEEWGSDDSACYLDIDELDVYVSGFSPAIVAVINVCHKWNIKLTLFHYDRETATYLAQQVN